MNTEHDFVCPKCGGHYFGRDTELSGGRVVALNTIRCHGGSSECPGWKCDWHGVWPSGDINEQARAMQ